MDNSGDNPERPNDPNSDLDPTRAAEEARAAAENDPEFAQTDEPDHDPYKHLRPYHWKKGQSGNPKGRPPGIRSLARRMRQAGSLRPTDIEAFGTLAKKLGLKDETLKGMDIMDLLTISTYLHAISGKGPAMAQVISSLTSTVHYTPSDSASKTPDDYRRDATRFYESVLIAPDIGVKDKIAARARLDAIQGLLDTTSPLGAQQLADEIRGFLEAADQSVPSAPEDDPGSGESESILGIPDMKNAIEEV
jgi:hypothetical protein